MVVVLTMAAAEEEDGVNDDGAFCCLDPACVILLAGTSGASTAVLSPGPLVACFEDVDELELSRVVFDEENGAFDNDNDDEDDDEDDDARSPLALKMPARAS